MIILGLDWLLFGGNALTAGTMTALVVVLGFVLGGLSTALIQRLLDGESWGSSLFKGLLAGIVVGVPLPIFGTFVGGIILGLAGLSHLRKR
jgi:hypothetical protein